MTGTITADQSRGLRKTGSEKAESQTSPQHIAEFTMAAEKDTPTKSQLNPDNSVASKPRISYNNGYGDFCFGRLIKRKRDPAHKFRPKTKEEELEEDLVTGSHGEPVLELDNFVR